MRRRMENGDDVRPLRWVGPAPEMAEREEKMKELVREIRRDGFVEGVIAGMAAEGLLVIIAVLWALR